MGDKRPMIKVTYEMELLTGDDELVREYIVSYDADLYEGDEENTDGIFIAMRTADLIEEHGKDTLVLGYSVMRENQVLN